MYHYTFADNLCRLCKERCISVDELSEKIDLSPRQISRYRNGDFKNLSVDTLIRIAIVLEVSANDLLYRLD